MGPYAFSITADADPDVLARVANVFTIANAAPASAGLERISGDRVQVDVAFDALGHDTAQSIRRKLEQLTCVSTVLCVPIEVCGT